MTAVSDTAFHATSYTLTKIWQTSQLLCCQWDELPSSSLRHYSRWPVPTGRLQEPNKTKNTIFCGKIRWILNIINANVTKLVRQRKDIERRGIFNLPSLIALHL